jgi:hypothetical protein
LGLGLVLEIVEPLLDLGLNAFGAVEDTGASLLDAIDHPIGIGGGDIVPRTDDGD